jgi:hypothetical protein
MQFKIDVFEEWTDQRNDDVMKILKDIHEKFKSHVLKYRADKFLIEKELY